MNRRVKVLFVCLGNICRSPTAHGIFQALVDRAGLSEVIWVDSAGTSDWHVGGSADSRSAQHARRRNYDLSSLRARQIHLADFAEFDYILAMDDSNIDAIRSVCPGAYQDRIKLLLTFADCTDYREVPDPYYSGEDGFELVLDLLEEACTNLLAHIRLTSL